MSSQMYALLRTTASDTDIVAVSTAVDNLKARAAVDADEYKTTFDRDWIEWGGAHTVTNVEEGVHSILWQIIEVDEV